MEWENSVVSGRLEV